MPIKKFISFVAKNDREFFFYRNVIMSSIKFVEFVTIFVLSRELKEQYWFSFRYLNCKRTRKTARVQGAIFFFNTRL